MPDQLRVQRGVGLIEVLVALLIISVGLLGIALLQTRALSSNNSAMTRSAAVVASYSVLDILRAQRSDALGLNQTLAADDCDASGSAYIAQQLNQWCEEELGAHLGASAIGQINCSGAGECTVTITFHTLDCGKADDGQANDGLCTQTVDDGRAQQIVTKAML